MKPLTRRVLSTYSENGLYGSYCWHAALSQGENWLVLVTTDHGHTPVARFDSIALLGASGGVRYNTPMANLAGAQMTAARLRCIEIITVAASQQVLQEASEVSGAVDYVFDLNQTPIGYRPFVLLIENVNLKNIMLA